MQIIKSWHATTKRQIKVIDYDFAAFQEKDTTRLIRKEIEEEQLDNDHKPFSVILKQLAQEQTDNVLAFNYYDTLRFITNSIGGLIVYNHLRLSAWRFIKEDYDVI